MPNNIAQMLAEDDAVGSEELEAAIRYLSDKIRNAEGDGQPFPFLAYRNRVIFETTLKLRSGGILKQDMPRTEA
jgi:hypothetical protein